MVMGLQNMQDVPPPHTSAGRTPVILVGVRGREAQWIVPRLNFLRKSRSYGPVLVFESEGRTNGGIVEMAEELRDFILSSDGLDPSNQRLVLVGHSVGGLVCAYMSDMLAPHSGIRVGSVVCVSTPWAGFRDHEGAKGWLPRLHAIGVRCWLRAQNFSAKMRSDLQAGSKVLGEIQALQVLPSSSHKESRPRFYNLAGSLDPLTADSHEISRRNAFWCCFLPHVGHSSILLSRTVWDQVSPCLLRCGSGVGGWEGVSVLRGVQGMRGYRRLGLGQHVHLLVLCWRIVLDASVLQVQSRREAKRVVVQATSRLATLTRPPLQIFIWLDSATSRKGKAVSAARAQSALPEQAQKTGMAPSATYAHAQVVAASTPLQAPGAPHQSIGADAGLADKSGLASAGEERGLMVPQGPALPGQDLPGQHAHHVHGTCVGASSSSLGGGGNMRCKMLAKMFVADGVGAGRVEAPPGTPSKGPAASKKRPSFLGGLGLWGAGAHRPQGETAV